MQVAIAAQCAPKSPTVWREPQCICNLQIAFKQGSRPLEQYPEDVVAIEGEASSRLALTYACSVVGTQDTLVQRGHVFNERVTHLLRRIRRVPYFLSRLNANWLIVAVMCSTPGNTAQSHSSGRPIRAKMTRRTCWDKASGASQMRAEPSSPLIQRYCFLRTSTWWRSGAKAGATCRTSNSAEMSSRTSKAAVAGKMCIWAWSVQLPPRFLNDSAPCSKATTPSPSALRLRTIEPKTESNSSSTSGGRNPKERT